MERHVAPAGADRRAGRWAVRVAAHVGEAPHGGSPPSALCATTLVPRDEPVDMRTRSSSARYSRGWRREARHYRCVNVRRIGPRTGNDTALAGYGPDVATVRITEL